MKEHGILFTPDNIRRIREGCKTQTRRVMTPQPQVDTTGTGLIDPYWLSKPLAGLLLPKVSDLKYACPLGGPGDRLYVKEGVIVHASLPDLVGYYMDGCRVTEHWEKRLTAMFMPKYAARLWLEITDVRVERLQDISDEDCRSEGCKSSGFLPKNCPDPLCELHHAEKLAYQQLWDSINKAKHPWKNNDWVWAITFRKLEAR